MPQGAMNFCDWKYGNLIISVWDTLERFRGIFRFAETGLV